MKLRSIASMLALAAVSASATPIGSTVTAISVLTPGSTVSNTDSWSGTPQQISAFAYNSSGQSSLWSFVDSYNWAANGNSGTIMMQANWVLANGDVNYAAAEGSKWQYTFTADDTGFFELNYSLTPWGADTFGLNGIYLGGDLGNGYFSNGDSGQYIANAIAGNAYTVNLSMNVNLSNSEVGLFGYDASMVGLFNFNLTGASSVPDTACTLSLLTLAFAALASLRRKLA